jgi:hypothetical protein
MYCRQAWFDAEFCWTCEVELLSSDSIHCLPLMRGTLLDQITIEHSCEMRRRFLKALVILLALLRGGGS